MCRVCGIYFVKCFSVFCKKFSGDFLNDFLIIREELKERY